MFLCGQTAEELELEEHERWVTALISHLQEKERWEREMYEQTGSIPGEEGQYLPPNLVPSRGSNVGSSPNTSSMEEPWHCDLTAAHLRHNFYTRPLHPLLRIFEWVRCRGELSLSPYFP